MKKSLLAAALIAGFAGVAHAETSVTLYGVVDSGIGWQEYRGEDTTGADFKATRTGILDGGQSSNRWGLRGAEDLGDGLQAIFVLENGFSIGTGVAGQSNRLFGRQATVGLKSKGWGTLEFGRQTNIASKYFSPVASPFGNDYSQAQVGSGFSSAASLRHDNMILYQTPDFSGFQLGVGYSFNSNGNQGFDKGAGEPNTRAWTAGLKYAGGPIGAALVYDGFKSADTLTNPADRGISVSAWALGFSYDFAVVKLHAGFGQTRNGWFSGLSQLGDGYAKLSSLQVSDGLKVNSYTLGLSAPVGANGNVLASWVMADPRDSALDKQNVFSLGYTYSLSKRTNLYAIGSYANHVAFQNDLRSTLLAVGLRHRF